jgi:xanthine dehydrogenase accessory factor
LAPLTIGIGPHFSAGGDVDLVIESAWGARLGAVIASGSAQRRLGEPERIAGLSWERFARSPRAGIFRTDYKIGDTVQRRSVVGTIEGLPVTAPISGTIRGLLPDGVEVRCGDVERSIFRRWRTPGEDCRRCAQRNPCDIVLAWHSQQPGNIGQPLADLLNADSASACVRFRLRCSGRLPSSGIATTGSG